MGFYSVWAQVSISIPSVRSLWWFFRMPAHSVWFPVTILCLRQGKLAGRYLIAYILEGAGWIQIMGILTVLFDFFPS